MWPNGSIEDVRAGRRLCGGEGEEVGERFESAILTFAVIVSIVAMGCCSHSCDGNVERRRVKEESGVCWSQQEPRSLEDLYLRWRSRDHFRPSLS